YQGLISALGLGLILGTIFYLLYQKIKPKNLLPFFLAHAVADVIGLTIISYILY
ncbi:TPA: CPBP family intramembrane glutamate endopeptidase, partial [Streptococcus suis]